MQDRINVKNLVVEPARKESGIPFGLDQYLTEEIWDATARRFERWKRSRKFMADLWGMTLCLPERAADFKEAYRHTALAGLQESDVNLFYLSMALTVYPDRHQKIEDASQKFEISTLVKLNKALNRLPRMNLTDEDLYLHDDVELLASLSIVDSGLFNSSKLSLDIRNKIVEGLHHQARRGNRSQLVSIQANMRILGFGKKEVEIDGFNVDQVGVLIERYFNSNNYSLIWPLVGNFIIANSEDVNVTRSGLHLTPVFKEETVEKIPAIRRF